MEKEVRGKVLKQRIIIGIIIIVVFVIGIYVGSRILIQFSPFLNYYRASGFDSERNTFVAPESTTGGTKLIEFNETNTTINMTTNTTNTTTTNTTFTNSTFTNFTFTNSTNVTNCTPEFWASVLNPSPLEMRMNPVPVRVKFEYKTTNCKISMYRYSIPERSGTFNGRCENKYESIDVITNILKGTSVKIDGYTVGCSSSIPSPIDSAEYEISVDANGGVSMIETERPRWVSS